MKKLYQKRKVVLLLLFCVATNLVFLSGCFDTKQDSIKQKTEEETNYLNEEEAIEKMRKIGEQISALDSIAGIDEIAIVVNGKSITKREIETSRAYHYKLNTEELIKGIIKTYAIESEAERLGIKPQPEQIENYLNGVEEGFRDETEILMALMEGLGITQEEYLIQQKEEAYRLFQVSALREYLELQNKNYEKYIENVVKNAEIEILDPEIQKIFD